MEEKPEGTMELLYATRTDAEQAVAQDVREKQALVVLDRLGIKKNKNGNVPFEHVESLAARLVELGERTTSVELRLMKDVKRSAVSGPNTDRGYLVAHVTTPAGNIAIPMGIEAHWNPNIRNENGTIQRVWCEADEEYSGYQLGVAVTAGTVPHYCKKLLGFADEKGNVLEDAQLSPQQVTDLNAKINSVVSYATKRLAVDKRFRSNQISFISEDMLNTVPFEIRGARRMDGQTEDVTESTLAVQAQQVAAPPPVDPNADGNPPV